MAEAAATERDSGGIDPVADLAYAVMTGTPTAPDAESALRILTARAMQMAGLHRDEAQDLVAEALTRVAPGPSGGLKVAGQSRAVHAAYLYTTLRRVIVDYHRLARHRLEVPVDEFPVGTDRALEDNAASARLHRAATADSVRSALKRARSKGDITAFQAGTYILDVLQEADRYPSSRETGDALGISHTAVAKALERLRNYFEPD